ncbi:MAG: lamin tail domain-containing protein [Bacteroidota bacterium]
MIKKLLLALAIMTTFAITHVQAQLVLNEILADPAANLPGDANGDGQRAFLEDEFLEFVNLGPASIDMSGYTYGDGVRVRETFPEGFVLGAGEVLLLFGLPSPSGPLDPGNFGGATIVHVDDTNDGLSLTNGGDTVRISDAQGNIVFEHVYEDLAGNDQSITLSPDLTGASYVLHREVAPDSSLFSPGTKADGSILSIPLILNEIHADPADGDIGDANGDGSRNNVEDEFLEFVNTGNIELDLSGFRVSDSQENRHTFPDGTILFPHQPIVVFGGGTPTGEFGKAVVQVSSSGNLSLTNGGDNVVVRSPQGDTLLFFTYGSEANINESINRNPDINGPDSLIAHTIVANDSTNFYSPGTLVDGTPFPFDASGLPTVVEFATTEIEVLEDVGTVEVSVRISGANADTATTVNVRVIGGTGASVDISNFAPTYSLTFPADSSTSQSFTLEVEDDIDPEGEETFIYAITSVSGPASASIGSQDTFTLTIAANDLNFPLLVNEIHADPKPGLEGDANGDGVRVFQEDEFIEFINISDEAIDISGYTYEDSRGITFHEFPDGTVVQPGEILVLFGRPLDIPLDPANFCNAIIQYASRSGVGSGEGLSLTNDGDIVTIVDTSGQVVIIEPYGAEGGMDQSLNRLTDGQRVPFGLHAEIAGDTTNLFSPGCMIDGMPFTTSTRNFIPSEEIKLYPNPTYGRFTLEMDPSFELELVLIRDLNGQTVRSFGPQNTFDVSEFSNGFYLVDIQTQKGRAVKKLIIQR